MSSEISKRLQEVIDKSGLTYVEIEKMSGVPKSAIQRYASGQTTKLPIDRIKQICNAVGASTKYVLGWDKNENYYGDHKKNLQYFEDKPELLQLYKRITEDDKSRLIIDAVDKLEPEDIEMVLNIINRIGKGKESE